ncbi:MAG: RNA polymerase sigma factor [Proteobacteria bacterium]|uniref:RNA polymerase sigma factor n=1 Tax=Aquabacterium sp. TaxID=1872578 RepID=UPI0035C67CDE|nr:RNA polymerase sigma factor [Pseudomonadota bacterium]
MDSEALVAVIPSLRRYARALVGDRAMADDLVQDTLERAWRHAARWQADRSLRAWLFTIMHNVRVDQLRRSPPPGMLQPLDALDDHGAGPHARATQHDGLALRDLATALMALPEEQRAVLLLVGLEDMSYAEVAATLGTPIGTVMSRLSRGRDRLRQQLAASAPAPRLKVMK